MDRAEMKQMWDTMSPSLNEKQRRQYAATLAVTYGYGGSTMVHQVTGLSLNTITAGTKEIEADADEGDDRVRRPGAGAKVVEFHYPDIQENILKIIDGSTFGNPEKIISWTTYSLRKISEILLSKYNIKISYFTVSEILKDLGYSKQLNKKMLPVGTPHPDRNEQFKYINSLAHSFISSNKPVISIDAKKKELIGNFKNNDQEYRKKNNPRMVLDHDFLLDELGKVIHYRIYNLNYNIGFINLGTNYDTAEFAVESISRWWECIGKNTFPNTNELLLTCDCGGNNSYKLRLWKYQLSQFAKRTSIDIYVSHFPPGTSKWNKIEHRLFCYITKNWQGKPLINIETAIELIGSTTTKKGLEVICVKDENIYPISQKVSDIDFNSINIEKIEPFSEWNYKIKHK